MNRQKQNWIIDLVLLVSFLLSFFSDFTGIVLHQWLGVIVTLLALIHLVLHWGWVKAVIARLFKKSNSRNRLYAMFDFLLMLGIIAIFETGLLISTWLNLDFSNYGLILDIHIWSSIATISCAVVKLGFHWRWIVSVAHKIFSAKPSVLPQPVRLPHAAVSINRQSPTGQSQVNRRQFLVLMSIVTGASAVAMTNVLAKSGASEELDVNEELQEVSLSNQENGSMTQTSLDQTNTVATEETAVEPAIVEQSTIQTPIAADQGIVQPAATTETAVSVPPAESCSVLCNKHCSYPGQCRKYVDSNSNNLCDRGECL